MPDRSTWTPTQAAEGALRVVYVLLDDARRWDRNPKRHDIPALVASLQRHGFRDPPIYDAALGAIVAGNGRLEALCELRALGADPPAGVALDGAGRWCLPVLVGVDAASRAQAEAFGIDHNALTLAGAGISAEVVSQLFDPEAMREILAEMDAAPVTLERELADAEVWLSAHQQADAEGDSDHDEGEPGDAEPEPKADRAAELAIAWKTAPGQVWEIASRTVPGRCHRVLCGDCRNPDDVARLLDGARVNVAFTSPPYASQRKYDEESGFKPIPADDYVEWFEPVQAIVKQHIAEDGSWFVNIKEHCEDGQRVLYVKDLTLAHVRRWGWRFVDELCWARSAMPMQMKHAKRFKNEWEPVFHFATSETPTFRPDNVLQCAVAVPNRHAVRRKNSTGSGFQNGFGADCGDMAYPSNLLWIEKEGPAGIADHEATFPVGLPTFFIKAYSDPGDVIFDPFLGSGTTCVAAERDGRLGYGTELSPKYLGVILQRLADMGLKPRLVEG